MMITDTPKIHFAPLKSSKLSVSKPKSKLFHELERKTPDSLGAKLVSASTALRAYRNRTSGSAHAML